MPEVAESGPGMCITVARPLKAVLLNRKCGFPPATASNVTCGREPDLTEAEVQPVACGAARRGRELRIGEGGDDDSLLHLFPSKEGVYPLADIY